MIQRRTFIGALGSSLAAAPLLWTNPRPAKRLALVTTEWRFRSHAWHMGERFLAGYPMEDGGTGLRSNWFRPMWTRNRRTT